MRLSAAEYLRVDSWPAHRYIGRRWRILAGAGMKSVYLDLDSILNRGRERASENLSFNKLLVQLGVDPSNITFDAVVQRLVDTVVAKINFARMCALVGAGFFPRPGSM